MMVTMVILFIACIVLLFVGIPLAYLRGSHRGEIVWAAAIAELEAPFKHECIFGPWSDTYTQKYWDGWRPTSSDHQRRYCLGCNIEEVREVKALTPAYR